MNTITLNLKEFSQFQTLIKDQCGLWIHQDHVKHLSEILWERVQALKLSSYTDYFNLLIQGQNQETEFKALFKLLTIGETYFFRNEPQFAVLGETVLPQLIQQKMERSDFNIKIWSAGCSSGEEPYSLAIQLKKLLPALEKWNVSLLATDLNEEMLAKAKAAIYSPRSVAHVPREDLQTFFQKKDGKFALVDSIKNKVQFRYHNLAKDSYHSPEQRQVDLILCRNVTIYFDLPTTRQVIAKFYESLAEGGYLVIGHAESLWNISDAFQPIEYPHTFFYQKIKTKTNLHLHPMQTLTHDYWPAIPQPLVALDSSDTLREGLKAMAKKDYQVALENLKNYLLSHPRDLKVRMVYSTALADVGNYEQAMESIEKILQVDNLYQDAYFLKGIILSKMQKFDLAIQEFRRLLYIDPNTPLAYFQMGHLHRFLNQDQQAKKSFLNCLKILQNMEDQKVLLPFSEELTASVLYQATQRALEMMSI